MHEVSLLENTLELALDYARQQNATQIHHLTLRVGQLSGVIPEALQFAFEIVGGFLICVQIAVVTKSDRSLLMV